ncbi:MAG: hypothetical protein WCL44_13685 [bacterium]
MKTWMLLAVLCGTLSGLSSLRADDSCWQTIKTHLATADTDEQMRVADQYIASLTPNQLIMAGRECSREIESKVDPKEWDVAAVSLGFFYQYYPRKADNLRDVNPIIDEIRNKVCPPSWRRFLVRLLLSSWKERLLTPEQRLRIAESLAPILYDNGDSIHVREEIPLGVANAIAAAVKAQRGNGNVEGQSNTVGAVSEAYVTNALGLFRRSDTPLSIRQALLTSLVVIHRHDLPVSDRVKDSVRQALHNHKDYPKGLWGPLLEAARRMKVDNIDAVAREMNEEQKAPEQINP